MHQPRTMCMHFDRNVSNYCPVQLCGPKKLFELDTFAASRRAGMSEMACQTEAEEVQTNLPGCFDAAAT
ncbi:hypothetical protein [Rhizobium leguminosarum]|uniref:hypothetical protein n=1 Tax=Rhizobium leguminosarum TaxID=384 RepID=UPI00143F5B19|nr:hypothetical protein [Rhizobium leguminosarum]MBY5869216.1 hypothetical protein [Rhizobium leguminosarum]NKM08349.1 hypothetical protein [Rhizobium leguminosarum bv. viciae]NKM65432.1 hypothetical protein [Rhizobium leguminosarum bv. viciae]